MKKSPPRFETDSVSWLGAAVTSCQFLLGGSLPEENIQKDDYLRPLRLRRSSVARNASSSGEQSLAGTEIAGTPLFSGKRSPPGRGFSAGGNHPKRSSPPTNEVSPRYRIAEIS